MCQLGFGLSITNAPITCLVQDRYAANSGQILESSNLLAVITYELMFNRQYNNHLIIPMQQGHPLICLIITNMAVINQGHPLICLIISIIN